MSESDVDKLKEEVRKIERALRFSIDSLRLSDVAYEELDDSVADLWAVVNDPTECRR